MTIPGHIENGVVIPRESISLPNGTEVTIVVPETAPASGNSMSPQQRTRYLDALARIDGIVDDNPGDQFSGADHDQELYGDRA